MPVQEPAVADEPESRLWGFPFTSGSSSRFWSRFPWDRPGGTARRNLELLPKIILRALTALAAPLVVLAILSAIVTNEIKGRLGALMMVFYLINTFVAMLIGLTLTNLIQPGIGASLVRTGHANADLWSRKRRPSSSWTWCRESIGEPFTQNHLAQLVVLTLALGIGLVKIRDQQKARGETSFRGGRRPADDRLRAADEGLALGGGPGAAGGLRDRGRERRPEGGDAGLRLVDLAHRRGGARSVDPGRLVPVPDVGAWRGCRRFGSSKVRST